MVRGAGAARLGLWHRCQVAFKWRAPVAARVTGKARLPVVLAFAVVYVVWGSTYLAIHDAIATIPPFLMAGIRFLVAGGLLYGWTLARGQGAPPRRAWTRGLLLGFLMLAGGNGFLSLAEKSMPTG